MSLLEMYNSQSPQPEVWSSYCTAFEQCWQLERSIVEAGGDQSTDKKLTKWLKRLDELHAEAVLKERS